MASLTVTLPRMSVCTDLNASLIPKTWQESWQNFLGVQDLRTLWIWRTCVLEMVFVGMFIFSSIVICTRTKSQFSSSPQVAIAFFHFLVFGLLLRAAIPPSDGHFNPAVTLCAVFTGMYTPLRGLMYITAQLVGAIVGAMCAKVLLPIDEVKKNLLSGCCYREDGTSEGLNGSQAFLSELLFSFILMYLVFMVCIDHKQFWSIGLDRVPLFVGMVTSLNIYVSGIIAPGYGGAFMNPARCIGPAVAYGGRELWSSLWIFCCAPALAAAIVAALYRTIPPDHRQLTSNINEKQLSTGRKGIGSRAVPVDEDQPGSISSVGIRSR